MAYIHKYTIKKYYYTANLSLFLSLVIINCLFSAVFAEREGFEPPVPCSTAVFKTAVIDHSTISPLKDGMYFRGRRCKSKKL